MESIGTTKGVLNRCIDVYMEKKLKVFAASTTEQDELKAIQDVCQKIPINTLDDLSWLLVFHTEQYDSCSVVNALKTIGIESTVHGGTTCMGVMTSSGFCSQEGRALGLLAIVDPTGSYGVGAAETGDSPKDSAALALKRALDNAERPGEMPALIWISAAPGCEELLIQGIEDIVGPNIPIAGGSTGDNSISGNWQQIANQEVFCDAVVISVFFPSTEVSQTFHSGYDPTPQKGIVTHAKDRTLFQIDHRPAVEVYNEWTNGSLDKVMPSGGNILQLSTFNPLGHKMTRVDRLEFYRLIHPEKATTDGALSLFASVKEGDEITLMKGSRDSLISRAGRVVKAAISSGGFEEDSIKGAIITYCAGCMLAVQDDMDKVAMEVSEALRGTPYLGIFTFGEQGQFEFGGQNTHGNLMISSVIFSDNNMDLF